MTDIPVQFSMMLKKRKQQPYNNLFNNYQRTHSNATNSTLPIITLSSFSSFKEKFIQMSSKNKSEFLPTTSTDFRMAQRKSHCNRSNPSIIPKSSLSYPTTIPRPTTSHRSNNQQNPRLLYIVNTPLPPHRTVSARIPNHNISPSAPTQQPNISRPHSQYEHFVAYLRRQSLARLRRKQAQEDGNSDNVQTTVTLNLNKQPSTQSFQSPSNCSLTSLTTDSFLMPSISITAKRAGRPVSSSRQLQRSMTSYRLSSFQQTPRTTSKAFTDDQLLSFSSPSLLITPRNSVVDDATMSPIIKPPYELHLNEDLLNYCYISDDSGVKYQGQMFSTAV